MHLSLGKYFGVSLTVGRDADNVKWLYGVVWYFRARNRLGYLYPAVRLS